MFNWISLSWLFLHFLPLSLTGGGAWEHRRANIQRTNNHPHQKVKLASPICRFGKNRHRPGRNSGPSGFFPRLLFISTNGNRFTLFICKHTNWLSCMDTRQRDQTCSCGSFAAHIYVTLVFHVCGLLNLSKVQNSIVNTASIRTEANCMAPCHLASTTAERDIY